MKFLEKYGVIYSEGIKPACSTCGHWGIFNQDDGG